MRENAVGLSANDELIQRKTISKAKLHHQKWKMLCDEFLPFSESIWRFSRQSNPNDKPQGWKLHISAHILNACQLFEKVAPFLQSQNVRFKAPVSLTELSKINQGLLYGYQSVGKFLTVYPQNDEQAVMLAAELDKLTKEFDHVSIPFDKQYSQNSSVFYRYGSFIQLETTTNDGKTVLAIEHPNGNLVKDDRLNPVPDWIQNPFPMNKNITKASFANTRLDFPYKIFRAITQRGKGGTYQALDFQNPIPRFCIIKEGRRFGELDWNETDGYSLVKNEFKTLEKLAYSVKEVPQVYESFEINGNFYLALEWIEGKSLHALLKNRRKRFSIKQILNFAVEIIEIVEKIHFSGWIWNDCKPANLILTNNKKLRPIDFENAYIYGETAEFDWQSEGFSFSSKKSMDLTGKAADLYSIGATVYFLLTGKFYDPDNPIKISRLRRKIPTELISIVEDLLSGNESDCSIIAHEIRTLLKK
ncbi:MAG TPA: AarF/UbiB family protein [Pyrinomonadaceae bacterium]|nr:AarF/UbiB family protein [Pyrinomonadaceae bacterium]